MIETNRNKQVRTHDLIRFPPIEKQVYDLFCHLFEGTSYALAGSYVFSWEGYEFSMTVGKLSVDIAMHVPNTRIGGWNSEYPKVFLPFNKDLTNRLKKFKTTVLKVKELTGKAKKLGKYNPKVIQEFLHQELATGKVTVRFWHEDVCDGSPVSFYIYPKGEAPADGVAVSIGDDGKIISKNIESAITGRDSRWNPKPSIEKMKQQIKDVEELQKKIDAFDASKCKELMELLENKKKANEIVKEFQTA
jgi:hypothetical protein